CLTHCRFTRICSESDPEEEPEEDDEDPEEDPADYPADRDDDDDDDDEDEDEDEEEEEEHPAPADSVPPIHRMTARISIRDEPSISLPPREKSCLPLRKRVCFASPTPSHEVGESSATGAATQDRPAIARDDPYSIAREDLYGFIDMVNVAPGHPMSRELDYGITDTWDDLVWICQILQEISQKRTRERMSDQEAKDIRAKAREIIPQPSTVNCS
ncbi:hypothetical protein Tco_1573413, partial [Tanacetum coccineum]